MTNSIETSGNYYPKRVLGLIVFFSVLKLVASVNMDLGTDESYYWLYTQSLQINYFDHPPIVAYWIRFFTANLLLQQYEVFIRLGSIIGGGLSTWFIYKALATVHSERSGWIAACLYNASLYAGITAGMLAMPDAPQMVFYTLSLWMLAKISTDEKRLLNWLLFGVASGLCIMSKIHGVYLWVGLGIYILINKRKWLGFYQLYVAAMIAIVIASPILIWNIIHDFVTYKFHSDRVVIREPGINWSGFVREIVGELVVNNPVNIVLIFFALLIRKKTDAVKNTAVSIFNYIGLSLLLTILFIALFRETLPHWSGVAYVALIPVAAIKLDAITKTNIIIPGILKWSMGIFIFVLITIVSVVNLYPGNFAKGDKENYGQGDLSVDNYGWSVAAPQIVATYKDELKRNGLPLNTPFVCNKWWGAHQEYYFCLPNKIQMIGLGGINELH